MKGLTVRANWRMSRSVIAALLSRFPVGTAAACAMKRAATLAMVKDFMMDRGVEAASKESGVVSV